jgi:GTP-binding protein
MNITSAEFIVSSPSHEMCPKTHLPEYAFIGRSNVGKSSLINMLVNRAGMAKISAKPGKTKLINHFLINKSWYLVDLPGYGFAKVSKHDRGEWLKFIDEYLMKRENLSCLFVLIDSRLEPQAIDLNFIYQLGEFEVPFTIVFTKTDKISKLQLEKNKRLFFAELKKSWDDLPIGFVSSSKTGAGRDEILGLIEEANNNWKSDNKFN